jgi:hypothetical protein
MLCQHSTRSSPDRAESRQNIGAAQRRFGARFARFAGGAEYGHGGWSHSLQADVCAFKYRDHCSSSSVYFPGWLDGGTSTRSYSGIVAAMTGPVDGCGGSAPVPSAEKIAKAIEITSPPRGIRVVPCQLTHDQAARLAEYWSPTRSVARPAARPRAAILAGWSLLAQPDLQDARSAEARFGWSRAGL